MIIMIDTFTSFVYRSAEIVSLRLSTIQLHVFEHVLQKTLQICCFSLFGCIQFSFNYCLEILFSVLSTKKAKVKKKKSIINLIILVRLTINNIVFESDLWDFSFNIDNFRFIHQTNIQFWIQNCLKHWQWCHIDNRRWLSFF